MKRREDICREILDNLVLPGNGFTKEVEGRIIENPLGEGEMLYILESSRRKLLGMSYLENEVFSALSWMCISFLKYQKCTPDLINKCEELVGKSTVSHLLKGNMEGPKGDKLRDLIRSESIIPPFIDKTGREWIVFPVILRLRSKFNRGSNLDTFPQNYPVLVESIEGEQQYPLKFPLDQVCFYNGLRSVVLRSGCDCSFMFRKL